MESEWSSVPIGECAEVYSGFAFKSKDLGDNGIPVIKIKNVNNKIVDFSETQFFSKHLVTRKHDKYFLRDGDVLIAMTGQGSVGRVGRIKIRNNQEVLLNQRVGRFIAKENLDIGYFYYVTSSDYYEDILFNAALGSGQPNLSPNVIEQITIPLPPLPEQKAIAHILGSLDDKIELNRQMNATLEGMAQALFKSWFVDFDPVIDNALAAGNPIPDALAARAQVRRQMLADGRANRAVATDFPAAFQFTDEMGWIPEGWETQPLFDMAQFVNGAAFKGKDFTDDPEAVPVIKIAEIKNGKSGQTKYTLLQKDRKYRIGDGEILLSWSGNPDTSIDTFLWTDGKGWLNQHIFRVVPHEEIERMFVFYQLKYLRPVFAELARDKQTTGLGHFTAKDMKRLSVFKPEQYLLKLFNHSVSNLFQRYYLNRVTSKSLAKLRDTLLPKLISGELRVPDAEKLAAEAGA